MQFHDPQVHRLLAEDRAGSLRSAMRASRADKAGLSATIATLVARLGDRRRSDCYGDRPAAAGFPR
jgi:hypothetical protein